MRQTCAESTVADLGGFKVFTEKPPFEIDFNLVGLNILIEQSDRDSLIEQSGRNALITEVLLEILAMCEKEERSTKVDDFFFGLQLKLGQRFCQTKAETPFKKSWIRHQSNMNNTAEKQEREFSASQK